MMASHNLDLLSFESKIQQWKRSEMCEINVIKVHPNSFISLSVN